MKTIKVFIFKARKAYHKIKERKYQGLIREAIDTNDLDLVRKYNRKQFEHSVRERKINYKLKEIES